MKKSLLILAVLTLAVCALNAQSKKKQKEEPIDNSYQVVNVTNEASVCYDTTSKVFALVCYVTQNNVAKTVQVNLGTEFQDIARNLMASMQSHGVKRRTIDYVLKYFVLYRDMPMENITFTLDYCSDYSLKLNLAANDYEITDIPITFAIADPDGKIKLKQKISLSANQMLKHKDIELIKTMINEEFVKKDAETDFFLKLTTPEITEEQAQTANEQDTKSNKKEKKNKKSKK